VTDYRTGEILAYAGSASYTTKGSKKTAAQVRRPRGRLAAAGLVDQRSSTPRDRRPHHDRVHDVHGRGGQLRPGGAKAYTPTQADKLERGPVRLRSALQFSLNIPAIKAGFINGLEHQFNRLKDFGLSYPAGSVAVASESIGTIEIHPIDLVSAYGMIGNGGVLVPHHTILRVLDGTTGRSGRRPTARSRARRGSQAGGLHHHRHPGGNSKPDVNPFWASGGSPEGLGSNKTRPSAYKTGTTNDNRDVHAYGYLAAVQARPPALVAGVWMGNWTTRPMTASCRWTRPHRCGRHPVRGVQGPPVEGFERLKPGSRDGTVDAFTGMKPARDPQDPSRSCHRRHRSQASGGRHRDARRRRGVGPPVAGGLRRPDG